MDFTVTIAAVVAVLLVVWHVLLAFAVVVLTAVGPWRRHVVWGSAVAVRRTGCTWAVSVHAGVAVDRTVTTALRATEAGDFALQTVDFAGKVVGAVFGVFVVRAGTHELSLFGFDLQDVSCVVFDELGVLVLELGNLCIQSHLICAKVGCLLADKIDFGA
jgi:hypothetical protein